MVYEPLRILHIAGVPINDILTSAEINLCDKRIATAYHALKQYPLASARFALEVTTRSAFSNDELKDHLRRHAHDNNTIAAIMDGMSADWDYIQRTHSTTRSIGSYIDETIYSGVKHRLGDDAARALTKIYLELSNIPTGQLFVAAEGSLEQQETDLDEYEFVQEVIGMWDQHTPAFNQSEFPSVAAARIWRAINTGIQVRHTHNKTSVKSALRRQMRARA